MDDFIPADAQILGHLRRARREGARRRRADEMARGTVDTQTRAMEEAARVVFRNEFGTALQRVTLPPRATTPVSTGWNA